MEEGPGLKVKQPCGYAKVQRVPAASVCPFGCGVFSVCCGFLFFALLLGTPFFFLGEIIAVVKPEHHPRGRSVSAEMHLSNLLQIRC